MKKWITLSFLFILMFGAGTVVYAETMVHDYNDEPFPEDDTSAVINEDGHAFIYEIRKEDGEYLDGLRLGNYDNEVTGYGTHAEFANTTGEKLSIQREDEEPFQFVSLEAGKFLADAGFIIRGYKNGTQVGEVEIDMVNGFEEYQFPAGTTEVDEIRIEHTTADPSTLIFDNFQFEPITNDPPTFISADTVSVDENETTVTTVEAVDPDGDTIEYSIIEEVEDAFQFNIDETTGELTFEYAPDYEIPADGDEDNVYIVEVLADDGELTVEQQVTVKVKNINDHAPVITSDTEVDTSEGTQSVTTMIAEDEDGDSVSFHTAGGSDASLFEIGETSGELEFLEEPDYENPADADGDNVYEVKVEAEDGVYKEEQSMEITVTDKNEPPVFITGEIFETEENERSVTTLEAADPEGEPLAYTVAGGADEAHFRIDEGTEELRFESAPDYEAPVDQNGDNVYELEVKADDGEFSSHQEVTVEIKNVNEHAPSITSPGETEVEEGTAAVQTVTAEDKDGSEISYHITGGSDGSLFEIGERNGELKFRETPDYEKPADAEEDNTYEVQVEATDGTFRDTQTLTIDVHNINDHAPVIQESEFQIKEQKPNGTVVGTITGTDPDQDPIMYSILSGNDDGIFSIDPSSGTITLMDTAQLDPKTKDTFILTIEAEDGVFQSEANVTIEVLSESSNSSLKDLQLDHGELSFESGTTHYSVDVGHDTEGILVTPETEDDSAVVSINGETIESGQESADVSLETGENIIIIEVTAEDGSTQTYEITVTRSEEENRDDNDSGSGSSGGGTGGSKNEKERTKSKTIGVDGGSIEVGDASIFLPEHAFEAEERITMERLAEELEEKQQPQSQKIVSDVFELTKETKEPFKEPAVISLPFDKKEAHPLRQQISLYWFDEDAMEWVELDNVVINIEDSTITGTVKHFTTFAVLASEPESSFPTPFLKPGDSVSSPYWTILNSALNSAWHAPNFVEK